MGVKYVGTEPSGIRHGSREIMPGDVVTEPADLVEYLRSRTNFEPLDDEHEEHEES